MRALRPYVLNRYVLTLGTIAVLVVAWNAYVWMNNGGTITGRVIDASGRPIANATVLLTERTLLVSEVRAKTTTDPDGRFRFTGHQLYHLFLEAEKEGAGRVTPAEFRLYFRGQNLVLQEPLRLAPSK